MYLARRLLALALAALVLPTAASAQRVLRYSDHKPLAGMRTRFIKDVFFAAIDKESNGRLKVDDRWDSVVSMPWGEPVFKAMRDKTMDGFMVNVDSGYMLTVHEVAPLAVLSEDLWLGHLYVLAMNRATWNGLAPEDKQAIQRAAETAYKTLGKVMDKSFDAQVDDLKKAGVTLRLRVIPDLRAAGFVALPPDANCAVQRWAQRLRDVVGVGGVHGCGFIEWVSMAA